MNSNYKQLTQKLDLCGQTQREAVRKQDRAEQKPQQIATDSIAAREGGFRSAFAGGHRLIDFEKLRDHNPAAFAFLVMNTRHDPRFNF